MGTGFWVIQGIFLTAAIATAVSAEVERRRDTHAMEPPTDFTLVEQTRLLRLRARIRAAQLGTGRLRDDLSPAPAGLRLPRWWTGGLMLLAGLALFAVGVGGIWQTNVMLDALERAQEPFSLAPLSTSFVARVVPGPLANPPRYVAANASSGSHKVTFEAAARLAQKQAMDRWEATLGLGLALLVASFAAPGGAPLRSLARNSAGLIGLAALACAVLSFFELA